MAIVINDVPLHVEICGEGKPLLILHGFLLDHVMMMDIFEPVFATRDGWQRIYVDMPGMGKTPAHPSIQNSDAIADLLSALMQQHYPQQAFALAGLSYGGYIVRGILRRMQAQVMGLALFAPVTNPDDSSRQLPEPRIFARDADAIAELPPDFASTILPNMAVQTRPLLEKTLRWVSALERADMPFLQHLRQTENYRFAEDVDDLPTPFENPTLILTGRYDAAVGYAEAFQLAQRYPRASYAVLDRAGHGVNAEQEPLAQALMHEWLDRVEEATQG